MQFQVEEAGKWRGNGIGGCVREKENRASDRKPVVYNLHYVEALSMWQTWKRRSGWER